MGRQTDYLRMLGESSRAARGGFAIAVAAAVGAGVLSYGAHWRRLRVQQPDGARESLL
jgi:hypothetical protein